MTRRHSSEQHRTRVLAMAGNKLYITWDSVSAGQMYIPPHATRHRCMNLCLVTSVYTVAVAVEPCTTNTRLPQYVSTQVRTSLIDGVDFGVWECHDID